MLVSFIVFVLIAGGALTALAFFMNGGRSADEAGQWVKDSVHAWREGALETDRFEVELKDTRVKDVFSSFDQAEGSGYLSMSEVNSTFRPVTDSFQHTVLRRHA